MDDAYRLLSDALAIHEALEDPHLTQIETRLAMSRHQLQRDALADAEARARAALAVAEGFRGGAPHSSWVGRSLLALGAARQARGDASGARALLTPAIAHMTPRSAPTIRASSRSWPAKDPAPHCRSTAADRRDPPPGCRIPPADGD